MDLFEGFLSLPKKIGNLDLLAITDLMVIVIVMDSC